MKHERKMLSPDSWPAMKEEIREYESNSDEKENRDISLTEKSCDKSLDHGKRVSRKVGEKMRRDRLNNLVATLAEEVPFVANSHRRLDKTAILRLTVSYMKLHHGLKRKRLQKAVGYDLPDGPYSHLFEQAVNGSLLIASESGEILFVSPNIRDFVGHNQTDLIGHNISAFIHPDDLQIFKSQFQERPRQSSSAAFATFQSDGNKDDVTNGELLESSESENFSMYIRLSKAVKKKTDMNLPKEYELLNVRGHIDIPAEVRKSLFDDANHMWMVAVLKPAGNQAIKEVDVGMSEFLKNNEWASQHGLDGKLWTVDQRGTLFHGYMVSETLGHTPYVFIKDEDLEYVARSHQLIMKENEIPSTVFRMKNKYHLDLYIQSRSIIIVDRWTKQPKCIVSVNTALSKDEGQYLLEEQRKRVHKLIAQTEQLALTDTEIKDKARIESRELLDSTGETGTTDSWKCANESDSEESSVTQISNKTITYNDSCRSEHNFDSTSPLNTSGSSSHSHSIHSVFSPSGSPVVPSDTSNSSDCHSDIAQIYSDTSLSGTLVENGSSGSPDSYSTSNSSRYSSYGVKRCHDDYETDFDVDNFDMTSITGNNSIEADWLLGSSDSSQTNIYSLHSQAFPYHTSKNSGQKLTHYTDKNSSHSENPLSVGDSNPLLKQMLARKSPDHETNRQYTDNKQCHDSSVTSKCCSDLDLIEMAQKQSETTGFDLCSDRWTGPWPIGSERDKIDSHNETDVNGIHSENGTPWCKGFDSESREMNLGSGCDQSVCNGTRALVVNSRKAQEKSLFSPESTMTQEKFQAEKTGICALQSYSVEPETSNGCEVQNSSQIKTDIGIKLSNQLHDKHVQLKQALNQQQAVLNSVGDQLKLGRDTAMSYDQKKLHRHLINRFSNMEHELQVQTGTLGDMEQDFESRNQDTKMADFLHMEEKR